MEGGFFMRLIPELNFNGNCMEALSYYKEVFNGELIQIVTYDDAVVDCEEEYSDKIFSAVLVIGKNTLYFRDKVSKNYSETCSKLSIMIEFFNEEEMRECFDKLSPKGEIMENIKETNWGSLYGSIKDKFGVIWNFNFELSII